MLRLRPWIVAYSPGDCLERELAVRVAHTGFERVEERIGRSLRKCGHFNFATWRQTSREGTTCFACALVRIGDDSDVFSIGATGWRK